MFLTIAPLGFKVVELPSGNKHENNTINLNLIESIGTDSDLMPLLTDFDHEDDQDVPKIVFYTNSSRVEWKFPRGDRSQEEAVKFRDTVLAAIEDNQYDWQHPANYRRA